MITPDLDEALCIAEEETGALPLAMALIQRPSFPLLNCAGPMQRGGMMGHCLPSHAPQCVRECPLKSL